MTFDKEWFRRFEQASQDERREMHAEMKRAVSQKTTERLLKAQPVRGDAAPDDERADVEQWLTRTRRGEIVDLDALDDDDEQG